MTTARADLDWSTLDHYGREALAFAIGSVLSHGAQLHGSMLDEQVEYAIGHAVKNMTLTAKISAEEAKEVFKRAYLRAKEWRKRFRKDAEDGCPQAVFDCIGKALGVTEVDAVIAACDALADRINDRLR